MRILDLFAGIGGFSLAAHWMGWKTVAFVEKEAFCQKVLRKNFGEGIEIHNDIFHFSGKPFRGRVDIVTGGFPCQPFSGAGKQRGRADERYLFPEMLRVIREVGPRWVVAENVRRLLGNDHGRTFAAICSQLEGEGFEVVTFCIPTSSINAPHERQRAWIIAHNRNGGGCPRRSGSVEAVTDSHKPQDRLLSSTDRNDSDRDCDGFWRHNGPDENRGEAGKSQGQRLQRQRIRPESWGNDSTIAPFHTAVDNSAGLQGNQLGQAFGVGAWTSRSVTERFEDEHWIEAAARLCRMDDVLPDELDVVGARDNRKPRIIAIGNSVAPVIPFEIFRAIAETERVGD